MSSTPVRPFITKTLKPVLLVKNKDIINYFKNPEVLQEVPTVHHIKKDDINNVRKDFKMLKNNKLLYMTIVGETTSKELADLSIRKDYFMGQKHAKKRLLIISAKLEKPSSNQNDFDTHAIVEQYEVKPIEGIKPPNVEFENIELVDDVKDMNGILINFVVSSYDTILIKMNEKKQIFNSNRREERKDALGVLNSSNYVHLLDNDIRASLHHIVVENNNSVLQEFHNLGFLQIYSQRKQPLKSIDEIIAKMKSGDFDEDFTIKNLSDLIDDPNLEMINEGNIKKYHIKESNVDYHYECISGGNGDLSCKKFLFDLHVNDNSHVVYYVFQVIETTKEDLKPFVGKALVQRVEEKHEIVRETDDLIHFIDAWLPMIKYKRQQLESQTED
jgi:hypothetical protein